MHFLNITLVEFIEKFKDYKIIFFGAGSWIKTINYTDLMKLESNFSYVIDNKYGGKICIGNKEMIIEEPIKLKKENRCIIILTSPVYQYEMYRQLLELDLSDEIICVSLPFLSITEENNEIDTNLLHLVKKNDEIKIPKIIHSFWFSGDEKPQVYQDCIDTWSSILTDYKIIEWNQKNYDCEKNSFLKKAVECKAWAYATDYARLDVLNEHGGIYLDMDVEVFKPFDDLLGNDALLSFSNNFQIDLAIVGSKKNNPLIQKLLESYEDLEIPHKKEEFVRYFQPVFVKPILSKLGVKMNGELQVIDNATVFPREFFMPQDTVLFLPYRKTENTYCNHLDNFGWSFSEGSKREKKIRENTMLWNMIQNN